MDNYYPMSMIESIAFYLTLGLHRIPKMKLIEHIQKFMFAVQY